MLSMLACLLFLLLLLLAYIFLFFSMFCYWLNLTNLCLQLLHILTLISPMCPTRIRISSSALLKHPWASQMISFECNIDLESLIFSHFPCLANMSFREAEGD